MLPPVWCVAGKEVRLKGFEFPKAVHLDPEPFSIDNDLITPKMSLKRPQLLKYYQKQVGKASSGSMKDLSAYYAE
jgi:long-chain acyl-CoA synthetase